VPQFHPPPDPLRALTAFSREVSEVEDPRAVAPLVADAAHPLLQGAVTVVLAIAEDGAEVAAVRGCEPSSLGAPEGLDSELARALVQGLPGIGEVRSFLLTSGGGLYGCLVVGWSPAAPPDRAQEQLAEALADMAATALDRAFRTSELHQTIRALIDSQAELARTASLRSLGQMAAVVAHEVKNPLTSIGGVLQVLRGRFPVGTPEHDVVGKVLLRLGELDRMVDELLSFARPRAPTLRTVSCAGFLDEVVDLFRQDPTAARVAVAVGIPEPVSAAVDVGMLQRVVHNLLINAAHATDGCGRIDVTCRRSGDAVEIAVADDGPGVPPDQRDRIFEPFFTTKVRGSGLGLAIARQVVEAHGGTLTLAPPAPGSPPSPSRGARFVLRLPVNR
jgi:signal transduction histidine kinase